LVVTRSAASRPDPVLAGAAAVVLLAALAGSVLLVPLVPLVPLVLLVPPQAVTRQAAAAIAAPATIIRPLLDI
jgi:hypothetical protein